MEQCPVCQQILKTYKKFATHMKNKHKLYTAELASEVFKRKRKKKVSQA